MLVKLLVKILVKKFVNGGVLVNARKNLRKWENSRKKYGKKIRKCKRRREVSVILSSSKEL